MAKKNQHVHNLVSTTLQYLDKRKEFWRHSSPNPEAKTILLSPRGPSSSAATDISTFRESLPSSPTSPIAYTFNVLKRRPKSASSTRTISTINSPITMKRPQSSTVFKSKKLP